MHGVVEDPAVQRQAIDYLKMRPAARCSEVADALHMARYTCERMLLLLAVQKRVTFEEIDLTGMGRPARLWSAFTVQRWLAGPAQVVRMTPQEMAVDIAMQLSRQPWPAWFLLKRPTATTA